MRKYFLILKGNSSLTKRALKCHLSKMFFPSRNQPPSFAVLLIGLSVFFLSSCSYFDRMVVKKSGGIIERGLPVFYEEGDLGLARSGLASNIKVLETLLQSAPKDRTLLLLTSQAISAYCYSFVEPEMERMLYVDLAKSELIKMSARSLYLRAKEYAKRALAVSNPALAKATDQSLEDFDLQLQKTSPSLVPNLFWLGFAWGGYINLAKEDVKAITNVVKVEHIMNFVVKHDETYFNGGAHLFLGFYYGSRPRMFGGDPQKADMHFKRVDQINKNRLLISKVMRAQTLSVQELNREEFNQLLLEVLQADPNLFPEQRLLNQVAKVRADVLRKNANELF